ncbi:DUF1127 domain-containing protein [Litoreibacter janthinus]|uniref:Uncharacterized conserved protein YjiS, DUF1127 family n=1 Tax=Litoreibacter janthinus TaxID=670154 RepID=A0A1I6GLQ9_9RHOB|nr:DUF1127 domain-containing protein [Litoreibacter janthinus]SFR43110.1 Uncharacterized conserved protein YjiS, DUF1127 family [Litoreibacter janthinus]
MTVFTTSSALARPSRRGFGLMNYIDLYRQRRSLAELDDTRLADLGLQRHEVDAEIQRPFWDAPAHWK